MAILAATMISPRRKVRRTSWPWKQIPLEHKSSTAQPIPLPPVPACATDAALAWPPGQAGAGESNSPVCPALELSSGKERGFFLEQRILFKIPTSSVQKASLLPVQGDSLLVSKWQSQPQ